MEHPKIKHLCQFLINWKCNFFASLTKARNGYFYHRYLWHKQVAITHDPTGVLTSMWITHYISIDYSVGTFTPWTQDVNWTYIRTSYVRSLYVLCLRGSGLLEQKNNLNGKKQAKKPFLTAGICLFYDF